MKRFHPSPSLVISLIALFVALGGTSYAAITSLPANSVGTAQIKNRAVTAAKINTKGLSVPTAAKALSPGTLPSGKTLTGVFHVETTAAATGASSGNAYSFDFRVPASLPASYLAASSPPTAECPGSVSAPAAAPGWLCLYEGQAENVATAYALDPQTNTSFQASPYGFSLKIITADVGFAYTQGTWAATAP